MCYLHLEMHGVEAAGVVAVSDIVSCPMLGMEGVFRPIKLSFASPSKQGFSGALGLPGVSHLCGLSIRLVKY